MFRHSKHVRTRPLARQPHVSPAFRETSLLVGLVVKDTPDGAGAGVDAVTSPALDEALPLDAMARSCADGERRIRVVVFFVTSPY